MKKAVLVLAIIYPLFLVAQYPYKFRVLFTDKYGSEKLLQTPDLLLSERALQRRSYWGIPVDSFDLPVSDCYLNQLTEKGFPTVCTSRWMNSAVVSAKDSLAARFLSELSFVKDARLVWKDNGVQESFFIHAEELDKKELPTIAESQMQIRLHNGDRLHQAGYLGDGMWIAVIDAGFLNVNKLPIINKQVLGVRDFVDPQGDIYATHPHGTNVLSTMSCQPTFEFSGTAPHASYWLLRSEDSSSEYPVEEDYWIAAAEYADSLGVDLINSSLGYHTFDDSTMNYTAAQLDGKQAFITQGAGIAASKGILVISSAGNDRMNPWQRISFPSDSPDILTVGAVTCDLTPSTFTGMGFVGKEYVKPDVSALGAPAYVIDIYGALSKADGTSFSAPILTGLAACLWQALPQLSNHEIIDLLRKNSSQYHNPDNLMGYGIPDLYTAYGEITSVPAICVRNQITLSPVDSAARVWKISGLPKEQSISYLRVINSAGVVVKQFRIQGESYQFSLNHLNNGLYIISLDGPAHFTQRIHLSL